MEVKPKRKPGRPRKATQRVEKPREGIVLTPSNADDPNPRHVNCLEIVYSNPIHIKKIFAIMSSYAIRNIELLFTESGAWIVGENRLPGRSEAEIVIQTELNGALIHKYYCETTFAVSMCLGDFAKLLSCVTQDHTNLKLAVTRGSNNKVLWIQYVDQSDYSNDNNLPIEPIDLEELQTKVAFNSLMGSDYPLQFEIESKRLKAKITEYIKLRVKELSISGQAVDGIVSVIEFNCTTDDGKINAKMGNIPCTPFEEEVLFLLPMLVSSFKAISSSLITKMFQIQAHSFKPIVITANIDPEPEAPGYTPGARCVVKVIAQPIKSDNNPNLIK